MNGCSPLNSEASLYIHVPFCHKICHYCDFAKTARYASTDFERYVCALEVQYDSLVLSENLQWKSIYFGGGTPSLLWEEYAPLLEKIYQRISCKIGPAEVTIEANPLDVTVEKLKVWKSLGFNRISLGVQSLATDELRTLTREHTREDALQAVDLCMAEFDNVSVDFIYGTPRLSLEMWRKQLTEFVALFPEISHLSCYALSFESSTVFGKRLQRGLVTPAEDDLIFDQYLAACEILGDHGYFQEEVSNWARHGFEAVHNSNYWQLGYYYGLGVGAHSFVPDGSAIGKRYSVKNHVKNFLDLKFDYLDDEGRTESSLWTEALFLGLRTASGVDLAGLKKRLKSFDKIEEVVTRVCREIPENVRVEKGSHRLLNPRDFFIQDAWIQRLSLFS